MERVLMVAGGRLDAAFCLAYKNRYSFSRTIAIDGGIHFFYEAKLKPDVIIGDLDSANEDEIRYFEEQTGITWLRLVPEKDDTDTEAAIRWAVGLGVGQIHILGGTGSRLDHVLGNIALLGIGLEAGVEILLADPNNRIRMIKKTLVLSKQEQHGHYVSLIPFTPKVTGVTLQGMKYPLNDAVLTCFSSLGISNEIVEEKAVIRLTDGILLALETKD